ncbi:MAG: GAF domain-containing protein [Myxococcota bacterium]
MSDLNDVRAKLDTFDADNDPEAFWDLLTDQATEQLDADVAFVVLLDEEDEFTVYPADDLEDLEQSFAFMAAIEALGSDAPALHNDPDDAPEPVFAVAVPMHVDGEVAGVLAVERYEGGGFTKTHAESLTELTAVFGPYLRKFFE